jgi:hypothetical protein
MNNEDNVADVRISNWTLATERSPAHGIRSHCSVVGRKQWVGLGGGHSVFGLHLGSDLPYAFAIRDHHERLCSVA